MAEEYLDWETLSAEFVLPDREYVLRLSNRGVYPKTYRAGRKAPPSWRRSDWTAFFEAQDARDPEASQ